MGREVVVAVTAGRLDFGPWEQIFYGEFDGRRREAGVGQDYWRVGALRAIVAVIAHGTPRPQHLLSMVSLFLDMYVAQPHDGLAWPSSSKGKVRGQ